MEHYSELYGPDQRFSTMIGAKRPERVEERVWLSLPAGSKSRRKLLTVRSTPSLECSVLTKLQDDTKLKPPCGPCRYSLHPQLLYSHSLFHTVRVNIITGIIVAALSLRRNIVSLSDDYNDLA